MGKLYVMCGAPGSGKSTWCQNYMPVEATYISRDDIRFSMLQFNEEYFSRENEVYAEFIRRINEGLARGDVYADATHLNTGSRKKLLRSVDRTNITEIIAVAIETSLETCLERNNFRKGFALVPEDALINMHKSYKRPSCNEGFNEIWVKKEVKINE